MVNAGGFAAGQTTGKFHILREIGRGGMGVVYLAEDTSLGRRVAVKILHGALQAQAEHYERFRQEARACASLCHPNIARIHSLDEVDGQLIIEMEYLEGGSLADCMYGRGILLGQTLQVARDVFLALERCHHAGIIHRDIKPSNILFDRDGRAMLTDFGLAKAMDFQFGRQRLSTTSSFVFLGTPRYAPPEAWEGVSYSPTWDIYSLGMVLYEAIAGRSPYDAETPLAFLKQLTSQPVAPLSTIVDGISNELSALVMSMLSHDPSDRPQSVAEAFALLTAVPEFVSCAPDSPTQSVRVKFHGEPWLRRIGHAIVERKTRWRPVALLCGAALLILFTYRLLLDASEGRVSAPQTSRRLQSEVMRKRSLASSELLALWKSSTPNTIEVCDTFDMQLAKRFPKSMLMNHDTKNDATTLLLARKRGIWWLEGTSQPDSAMALRGYWAAFGDTEARLFRHGTITGTGAWTAEHASLTLNVTLECDEDGISQSFTIASSPARGVTDTQFLYNLESADQFLPLLYSELLQRRLPWAQDVERLFPCLTSSRVVAPQLSGLDAAIHLDGRLNDSIWREEYFGPEGRAGELVGWPLAVQPELKVVYDKQVVYFAVRADDPQKKGYRLELVFVPLFGASLALSRQYHVTLSDGKITDTHLFYEHHEVPWSCSWSAARTEENGSWSAEIRAPSSDLALGAAPAPGSEWRFNLALYPTRDDANTQPVARWGFPDLDHVEHGASIMFGGTPDARSEISAAVR